MPETNTANPGTINRQSWTDDITLIEPQETPYTSMANKTAEAIGLNLETFTDRLEAPRTTGAREGGATGQGGNKLKNIKRHGAYAHFSTRSWGVTSHQKLVARKGGLAGVADAVSRSKAQCQAELKRDMEAVNMSNLDTQNGSGGSADMQTRGGFYWTRPVGSAIGTAGNLDYVDPTVQVTAAASLVHGASSAPLFSESQLYGLLKEAATIRGKPGSFDGLNGTNVVETLDLFSRIASPSVNVSPPSAAFYTVRSPVGETQVQLMVNIYKSSFGMVNSIPEFFNQIDSAGLGDPNAALIIDRELWRVDVFEDMHEANTYDTGTVEGGHFQCTWINLCDQPRGNIRITQS